MSRKLLTNIRSHTIGFLYYLMAVLTAIAIPVFTSQMEKAREATDLANVRSAYGELVAQYLTDGKASKAEVPATQTQSGWQSTTDGKAYIGSDINVSGRTGSGSSKIEVANHTKGTSFTLEIDTTGKVTTK